mgnify:FL=1
MYLKELSINGFKSFAKRSELEFSAQVTGIVGPNGSGKSNVAEAFRFVLGEQSVKSMRGKRGEDLIFSGTDKAGRSNRASVAVVMDNSQKVFPIDFDEVKLERVVHRDGQNEYLINDSKVRLKDVQELLASANIGSTGHHIISQGEADRILTASPRERREMIEDALGLKVFQYKKAEAERKLQKTQENIAEVGLLRKEAAPHFQYLERQIKKIERSVALREELSATYAEYLRREDVYIASNHDRLTAERREREATVQTQTAKIEELKSALAAEEQNEKRDELVALEGQVSAARTSQQELLRQSGQLEGQIEYIKRRITEKQQRTGPKDVAIPLSKVTEVITSVTGDAEKALQKGGESVLERSLADLVHVLKRFVTDLSAGEHTPDTKTEESDLKEREAEMVAIKEKLTTAQAEEAQLTQKAAELREALEAESVESREAERTLFAAMNELRAAEAELSRLDRELDALERDRTEFKRELNEAVTLIGRAAASYYDHTIMDGDTEVTAEMIAAEDREIQRERRRELEKKKIRLEELGIGSTEEIEQEYKDAKERDEFLAKEIADLEASVTKLEALIVELTNELNEQFGAGTDKIAAEFKKFFTLMFGGGDAELKKVTPKPRKQYDEEGNEIEPDEDIVLEEGIELDVKLPNKRVRGLEMLSGGERALTSIALIFAMSQVNPPPFIILDETDAALDEANSRRYGDMIQKSQLILITHNRETMSRAGVLYGITMGGDGVSKLLSVKFDEAVAVAK